jgi:recombinational DNA repair protein RecR
MLIVEINSKSTLESIIANDATNGTIRQYIIDNTTNAKLNEIVKLAQKLQQNGTVPFIEVKFKSQYSSREKRLEVVGKKGSIITIYKFSSFKRFDKDAIELNRLVEEIVSKNNKEYIINGTLLFDDNYKFDFITQKISEFGISINIDTK